MKSLKLMLASVSVISMLFVFFGCGEKTDNPFRTDERGFSEVAQFGDTEGAGRMTPPLPPFSPYVVRSIKWSKPSGGAFGTIAYDGRLCWLGGSACPWEPTCGLFYGINFGPSLKKTSHMAKSDPQALHGMETIFVYQKQHAMLILLLYLP